jgi:hypothetical protein
MVRRRHQRLVALAKTLPCSAGQSLFHATRGPSQSGNGISNYSCRGFGEKTKKIMRIITEYNPDTHHVTLRYGSPIQRLFRQTSKKISETFDPETYSQVCRDQGDTGPHDFMCGSVLIKELARSRVVTASGEDCNFAVELVAWSIVVLTSSRRPLDQLPLALTALAYVAPIELPELDLPSATEVLDETCTPELRTAYESVRCFEGLKKGAVPVVASAHKMWLGLRNNPSSNREFQIFVFALEASTTMYRLALENLAAINREEMGAKGGRR